jgi:hypothetical protein
VQGLDCATDREELHWAYRIARLTRRSRSGGATRGSKVARVGQVRVGETEGPVRRAAADGVVAGRILTVCLCAVASAVVFLAGSPGWQWRSDASKIPVRALFGKGLMIF